MKTLIATLALTISASLAHAHSIVGTQSISCAGNGDSEGLIHVEALWDVNALDEKIGVRIDTKIRGREESHEAAYQPLRSDDGEVIGRTLITKAGTLEIRDYEDSDYANPEARDNGTFHSRNGSSYSLACAAAYSSNGEE